MEQVLRLPQVKATTVLSRSTIYQRMAEGTFPRPVKLGPRGRGWLDSDIQAWIQTRVEATRRANNESQKPGSALRE